VNLEFTAYFWMYLVCMQVLHVSTKAELPGHVVPRKRASAFDFAAHVDSGEEQGSAPGKSVQDFCMASQENQVESVEPPR